MTAVQDHYAVLGVPATASIEEIDAAFRAGARRWHPDRAPEADATARMAALNAARHALIDPVGRAAYDAQRRRQRPPRPVLDVPAIRWHLRQDDATPLAVRVQVMNLGGPAAAVTIERTAGRFWVVRAAVTAPAGAARAFYDIAPTGLGTSPLGPSRDVVHICLDDVATPLSLELVLSPPSARAPSASWAPVPDVPPRRRWRRRRAASTLRGTVR